MGNVELKVNLKYLQIYYVFRPMSEWVYHKTILFACPFLVVSKQKAPPQLWLCTVKRALEYATNSLPEVSNRIKCFKNLMAKYEIDVISPNKEVVTRLGQIFAC